MGEKEYRLQIDPRILELLGPSLYTNIYYVLAELIANAYDADAKNVYVIAKDDRIIVEDDGKGMSYNKGEVTKYLNIAQVSRHDESDSFTAKHRRKMGRKGVGKLAALSVSEEVLIKTISNGEKSGFILTRHPQSETLEALQDDEIVFERIDTNGTCIEMLNPQYSIHKSLDAVKRNLLKIFPFVSSEFRIHIIRGNREEKIESFDYEIANQLCACILLGNKSMHMEENFTAPYAGLNSMVKRTAHEETLLMKNNDGEEKEYTLRVEGWIGAYKTTRGRKKDASDFPDNFISLYANDKMGEFNILPLVGKNKLPEVYVVGQLYVDLFEESELPDMALSNRQGYKSDDERYVRVITYVRDHLLPEIVNMRVAYAKAQKASFQRAREERWAKDEEKFNHDVENFKQETTTQVVNALTQHSTMPDAERLTFLVQGAINRNVGKIGLKPKIDAHKKRILISHAGKDSAVADVVYQMLQFNNVPLEDIIYSSSEDARCRIPLDQPIYEYLRKFFVQSASDRMIYVVFVTSENTIDSWGAMVEIGAAWITQVDHKIVNVENFRPEPPLNVATTWTNIKREDDKLKISRVELDDFCTKMEYICNQIGYIPQSHDANKAYLRELLVVTE